MRIVCSKIVCKIENQQISLKYKKKSMKYLSVVTVLKTTVKLGGRPLKCLAVFNRSGKQSLPPSKPSCMRCLQLEGK